MSTTGKRATSTARIYKATAHRAKIVLAASGVRMADLLDEALSPVLDRLEREHLGRYGSQESRTRSHAID